MGLLCVGLVLKGLVVCLERLNPFLRGLGRERRHHAHHDHPAHYLRITILFDRPFWRNRLSDSYFIDRKLYPNVDFYSGITLKAMGFPTSMFTVLFAVARTVGWISQWSEMIEDPHQKIGRPRQLYTGAPQRDYVPISRRKSPMR